MIQRSRLLTGRAWAFWFAMTALVTVVLYRVRGDIDQAAVVLTFLLVVLGGSVAGGRALGFLLACTEFLLIDYYFQTPFDVFGVEKPVDWVVLAAFLAVAGVTTQLLSVARAEAHEARHRADEIASLSRLGSETLNAARPDDALGAIARVVQTTLGVAACEIFQWNPVEDRIMRLGGTTSTGDAFAARTDAILTSARYGAVVIVRPDGHVERMALDSDDVTSIDGVSRALALAVPLRVHAETVGVLAIDWGEPAALRPSQRRFLAVLSYYAALGVDRALLAVEAEHAEALREADRLKDMLLASVSHDLRTPLTTIKALAQQLALQGDATASIIAEQADRVSRMVSDVLDLTRIKSGHYQFQAELNTADDVIGAVARHTAGLMHTARLDTAVDLTKPALIGRFDFSQTVRILGNLIENAVRFAPAGGAIELGVVRRDEFLFFAVADRGPGVAPVDRRLIFEAFYRPTEASPDAARAGLGLSIARALAEGQGGSLDYSPRPGGGSVFTLRLPAAEIDELPAEGS